jgi:hypothetical protein
MFQRDSATRRNAHTVSGQKQRIQVTEGQCTFGKTTEIIYSIQGIREETNRHIPGCSETNWLENFFFFSLTGIPIYH